MSRSKWALVILLCVAWFAVPALYERYLQHVAQSTAADQSQIAVLRQMATAPVLKPEFDWVPRRPETFVATPTQGAAVACVDCRGNQFRVHVKATMPVMVFVAATTNDHPTPDEIQQLFLGTPCRRDNVLEATIDCSLHRQPDDAVVVLAGDLRSEPSAAGSFFLGALAGVGVKQPLQDATTRNDVTFEIYDWKCIRNCGADRGGR